MQCRHQRRTFCGQTIPLPHTFQVVFYIDKCVHTIFIDKLRTYHDVPLKFFNLHFANMTKRGPLCHLQEFSRPSFLSKITKPKIGSIYSCTPSMFSYRTMFLNHRSVLYWKKSVFDVPSFYSAYRHLPILTISNDSLEPH